MAGSAVHSWSDDARELRGELAREQEPGVLRHRQHEHSMKICTTMRLRLAPNA